MLPLSSSSYRFKRLMRYHSSVHDFLAASEPTAPIPRCGRLNLTDVFEVADALVNGKLGLTMMRSTSLATTVRGRAQGTATDAPDPILTTRLTQHPPMSNNSLIYVLSISGAISWQRMERSLPQEASGKAVAPGSRIIPAVVCAVRYRRLDMHKVGVPNRPTDPQRPEARATDDFSGP